MKFLPPEPTVDLYNEGFETADVLRRKETGKALSRLLDNIEDPIVVALDGKWGTGKSYFLKRWVGAHTIENGSKATTVYFDAFEHDYLSDPLPALVSTLEDRLPSKASKQIASVKQAAFKMAKPLARIGMSVATFGATEALDDLGDAVVSAVSQEASAGLETYWTNEKNRRDAMIQFKKSIEKLASKMADDSTGSSLVIVIDELDRCRPDYALEVLEVIKHFFALPRVHFVLGVNLSALENSVRARFGQEIDAQAYLRKFIHVTMDLPSELGDEFRRTPANILYLRHLIKEVGVPTHIAESLQNQVEIVVAANQVSMRDIGKIVSSISLIDQEVIRTKNIYSGWLEVMNDLVVAKVVNTAMYQKLLNGNATFEELATYFGVNGNNIQEEIDGERNEGFNRKLYWKVKTWQFLCQNGQLADEDIEISKSIARQFDSFGRLYDAKKLPMKIHLQWLDQFNFYID